MTVTLRYKSVMKARVLISFPPKWSRPQLQAARKFQQAPPLLFGSGVMTLTPGFTRSSQSRIPFGFPLRTRKTMVDVYGAESLAKSLCQLHG